MARPILLYGVAIRDALNTGNIEQMKELATVSGYLLRNLDDAEAGTEETKTWEAAQKELITAIAEKESIKIVAADVLAVKDGISVVDNLRFSKALKSLLDSDAEGPYIKISIGWD